VSASRLPRPGETVTGGEFARHHGGKGGNQAVAAARLGAATSIVGAVGEDDFGSAAIEALATEGIDTSAVSRIAGEATGVALILVGESGENLISVASGANAAVGRDAVRSAFERLAPREGDVVLVGHEIPTAAARDALSLARSADAITIFNPAPPEGLDRATLGLADVLTPNRIELAALAGSEARKTGRSAANDPIAMARSLLERSAEGAGPRAVLVSLGPAGALLIRPAEPVTEIPAHDVTAIDTTGAGDTVNGVLAASLAAGRTLEEAARRAILAASLSTMRAGARGGMPTASELEAAL